MITAESWTFPLAKTMGKQMGYIDGDGFSGYAENQGETQPAMEEVLEELTADGIFAKVSNKI